MLLVVVVGRPPKLECVLIILEVRTRKYAACFACPPARARRVRRKHINQQTARSRVKMTKSKLFSVAVRPACLNLNGRRNLLSIQHQLRRFYAREHCAISRFCMYVWVCVCGAVGMHALLRLVSCGTQKYPLIRRRHFSRTETALARTHARMQKQPAFRRRFS